MIWLVVLSSITSSSLKPAVEVLASAGVDELPAVVRWRLGSGSVLAVMGEGLWRWAMPLPPEAGGLDLSSGGGGVADAAAARARYDTLWSGVIRTLALGSAEATAAGALLTLEAEGPETRPGEAVTVRVLTRPDLDAEAAATLLAATDFSVEAGGQTQGVFLRAAEGGGTLSHTPAAAGSVTFRASTPAVAVDAAGIDRGDGLEPGSAEPLISEVVVGVRPPNMEQVVRSADPRAMAALAAAGGGRVLDPSGPDDLLETLDAVRISRVLPPVRASAWDRPWVWCVLLLLFVAGWCVRKAVGLR